MNTGPPLYRRIAALVYKNYLLHRKEKKFLLMGIIFPIFLFSFYCLTFPLVSLADNNEIRELSKYNLNRIYEPFKGNPEIIYCVPDHSKYTSGSNNGIPSPSKELNFIKNVLDNIVESTFASDIRIKNFSNIEEIDLYLIQESTNDVLLALLFDQIDFEREQFTVTIMYNGSDLTTLPATANQYMSTVQSNINEIRKERNITKNTNTIGTIDIHSDFNDLREIMKSNLKYYLDESRNRVETANTRPSISYQEFSANSISATIFMQSGPYMLSFGLTFLIPLFVQIIVIEIENETKSQLLISGVSPILFWITRFINDIILYVSIVIVQFILGGAIGKIPALVQNNTIIVFSTYILYGFEITLFSYTMSFLFKKAEDASKWSVTLVSLGSLTMFFLISFLLKYNVPDVVNYFLCFLPFYPLFHALTIYGLAVLNNDPVTFETFFGFQGYGKNIVILTFIMVLQCIIFSAFIILMEFIVHLKKSPRFSSFIDSIQSKFYTMTNYYRSLDNIPDQGNLIEDLPEDEDVIAERDRVLRGDASEDIVRVRNVSKVFYKNRDSFKAVNHVSLGIPSGEAFCLLGQNGAGKTTLLNIITGQASLSSGSIEIENTNIFQNRGKALGNVGICPQKDRQWENLSPREHIRIYLMLRGGESTVNEILEEFRLTEFADTKSKELSGGNRRKLSVALAFIGSPKLILLDEPSSGMDPQTRRVLWDKISLLKQDRAVVLTTHSMEEADALSDRIGIMVNGSLKCLGSSHHLKNKHGSSYRLSLTTSIEKADKAYEFAMALQPNTKLLNRVGGSQQFEIPKQPTEDDDSSTHNLFVLDDMDEEEQQPQDNKQKTSVLPYLFEQVERKKAELEISDYAIYQSTLDQVFLQISKNQN